MVQVKVVVTTLLAGLAVATPIRIKLPTGAGWAVNFCKDEACATVSTKSSVDFFQDNIFLKYVGGNSDPLAADCQVLGKFDKVEQHVGCVARDSHHGCNEAFSLNKGWGSVGFLTEKGTVCSFFHGSSCDAESKVETHPFSSASWKGIARPYDHLMEDGTLSFRCYYDEELASTALNTTSATTPSTIKTPLGTFDAGISRVIVHADGYTIEQDIDQGDGIVLDPEVGHDFDPYGYEKHEVGHDYL